MIRSWTERARRFQDALERSLFLRAAFTAYSFITLLFFAPAPALGSPTFTEIVRHADTDGLFTLLLAGGDPAARESGDQVFLRDEAVASRLVDSVARQVSGSHAADWISDVNLAESKWDLEREHAE
jgi:hypothetical protein